jgi:hypothetical protein
MSSSELRKEKYDNQLSRRQRLRDTRAADKNN